MRELNCTDNKLVGIAIGEDKFGFYVQTTDIHNNREEYLSESIEEGLWCKSHAIAIASIYMQNYDFELFDWTLNKDSRFAEKFWTPYEYVYATDGSQFKGIDLIGKSFVVLREKDQNTYDHDEIGKMYIVKFRSGLTIEAYPEEVEVFSRLEAGENKYPKGFYDK